MDSREPVLDFPPPRLPLRTKVPCPQYSKGSGQIYKSGTMGQTSNGIRQNFKLSKRYTYIHQALCVKVKVLDTNLLYD